MVEVTVASNTIDRVLDLADGPSPEGKRQLLGLRLLRTLADLDELVVHHPMSFGSLEPLEDDPRADPRYGWPLSGLPELVEIVWPGPSLSERVLESQNPHLTPWALHSLLIGEWGAPIPGTVLRLPKCVALQLCGGLTESPAGHDLLRLTSQVEVTSFPTSLHSHFLVCAFADGVGQIEFEIQVIGPDDSEVSFAIKSVFCDFRDVPSFYVATLDGLEVGIEGRYWFILRLLGEELSRLPIEIGQGHYFEKGGPEFGQSWTWEGDAFFRQG